MALFIFSYTFIIEAYTLPPAYEDGEPITCMPEDFESSYILENEDHTYVLVEDNSYSIELTADDLSKEPYCNLPIYKRQEELIYE